MSKRIDNMVNELTNYIEEQIQTEVETTLGVKHRKDVDVPINSCDCNISAIIRWEYGEDAMPDLDCGDEIKLVAYKIEHWNSYYQKYDGDELIWRLGLDNKV